MLYAHIKCGYSNNIVLHYNFAIGKVWLTTEWWWITGDQEEGPPCRTFFRVVPHNSTARTFHTIQYWLYVCSCTSCRNSLVFSTDSYRYMEHCNNKMRLNLYMVNWYVQFQRTCAIGITLLGKTLSVFKCIMTIRTGESRELTATVCDGL